MYTKIRFYYLVACDFSCIYFESKSSVRQLNRSTHGVLFYLQWISLPAVDLSTSSGSQCDFLFQLLWWMSGRRKWSWQTWSLKMVNFVRRNPRNRCLLKRSKRNFANWESLEMTFRWRRVRCAVTELESRTRWDAMKGLTPGRNPSSALSVPLGEPRNQLWWSIWSPTFTPRR